MKTNATNNPNLPPREVNMIPSDENLKLGDTTKYNGKTYKAIAHYSTGPEAYNSKYSYFMFNSRGVFGMEAI